MSYSKLAGKSVMILGARTFWTALVNFAVVAYLARHLSKDDFGIVALSGVVVSFITVLGKGGIGEYIIYKSKDKGQTHLDAAFWLNFFLSLSLTVALLALSPLTASFYGEEKIKYIVVIISGYFFLNQVGSIPRSILRRDLQFKKLTLITSIGYTISSVLKVVLAFYGYGVYSLALPELLVSPFILFLLFYKSGFRPSLSLHIPLWKDVFKYSKGIMGGIFLQKVANDGDTLLTGKLLGLRALGVYNLAFQVSNVFTNYILPIINEVTFPFLAKISDQQVRVQENYLKMISLISFLSFPLLTLLFVGSRELISVWYGDNWAEAVLPLQILLIFTISRSISSPSGTLFQLAGRNDLGFYNAALNTVAILLGVFIGGKWFGLIGVCWGVTISRVITGQYQIARAVKLIGLTYDKVLPKFMPVLIASAISALLVQAVVMRMPTDNVWLTGSVKLLLFPLILTGLFRFVFIRVLEHNLALLRSVYPKIYHYLAIILRLPSYAEVER